MPGAGVVSIFGLIHTENNFLQASESVDVVHVPIMRVDSYPRPKHLTYNIAATLTLRGLFC